MSIGIRRDIVIDIVIVIVESIITSILALWKVFLHIGYIYQRDSFPLFYLTSKQLASSYLGFPFIMDNVAMPIVILLYFNIISPMIADWISYFIFPFALAIPSMYFASKYFLNRYEKEAKDWIKILVSITVSFLYAITPTAYYYSHWSDYAAFYALLPALIAGSFYSLEKGGIKGAFLLALFASLTTTDPRGFVYTLFIIITVLIYKHRVNDLKTFLYSIPFYLAINSRLFLILYYNFHSYSSISFSISNEQLWLAYLTFPLLDSLRGLGLFRPLVSYLFGNYLLVYILSFSFAECGILGYIFLKKRGSVATYLISLYLFLVLIISSSFNLPNINVRLNLIYPLLNVLSNTFVYNYLWLFLPTYLSEMVLAPLFILVSLVLAKILSNRYLLPLFVLIIVSQFIFSSSMVISGNYLGYYNPQVPPKQLVKLADFLETHAVGNVMVTGVVPSNWLNFFDVLPNSTSAPFYKTPYLGVILNEYGIQYVVTTENCLKVLNTIYESKDFTLVYNNSYFLVFKNDNFTYNIISPIYVNFAYPNISPTKISVNVIPDYLMFSVPPQYIGGYVGNVTYAELLALSAYKQGVKPVKLSVKHLPYPTNFTDTIYVNVYDEEILAKFPDIAFISVSISSSLNINVSRGIYKVIIVYVSVPGGGVFGVTNGSTSLSVFTFSPNISVCFSYLGNIYVSNGLKLFFKGSTTSYLLALMLIPNNISILSFEGGENMSSYPLSTSPTGRAFGRPSENTNYFTVIMVNLVTILISIISFLVINRVKNNRTHFRWINLKILFPKSNYGK
jgi:hypothetical protein